MPIQVNDVSYAEEPGSMNIEVGTFNAANQEVYSLFVINVTSNPHEESLKDWFENNIDDGSDTLLTSGAFVQEQLPNGPALVRVAPIPPTYQGGPVEDAYLLAPSGDSIYSVYEGQDESFVQFGYSASSTAAIPTAILGSIKYNEQNIK